MAAISTEPFHSPYGTFALARYPSRTNEAKLAWCAADTLLLEESYLRGIPGAAVLVVNDSHGALSIALQPQALWTDSAITLLALRSNEQSNARVQTPVVWSTLSPPSPVQQVVLRIPKQLPFLEYQLTRIAQWLPVGGTLLAAGMDKHLSPHVAAMLERCIGPTQRHPGQRKARLFSATRDDRCIAQSTGVTSYYCAPLSAELRSHANVFSGEKLDLGSRFLLEQMHRLPPVERLIDLACGNGVLGLTAVLRGLAQHLVLCDESAMAIASAQENANRLLPQMLNNISVHHGDALLGYQGAPAQLMLCNPPFHQEHVVDVFVGRHLITQCSRHIQSGGQLCLVANRHLDYSPALRQEFAHVERFASNSKFTILLAGKR